MRPLNLAAHVCTSAVLLLTGCAAGGSVTIVEGQLLPRHFHFVTVVEHAEEGPGGWRAACLKVPLSRDVEAPFFCQFGVEMPLVNKDGPISTPRAQRLSARCANAAAQLALSSTTPATPLGLACEHFKTTYNTALRKMIAGSRVKTQCDARTTPFQVGP